MDKLDGGSGAASGRATRIVFYGFGAYVGTISGTTQCAWWPDDPVVLNFNPRLLVPIDLARSPATARTSAISVNDIQVDDHRQDGGLTQIGPRFPQGTMVGACWLREEYWLTLASTGNQPQRGFSRDGRDYEFTSVLYWDGPLANRRFYGFHARVNTPQGSISSVDVWHGGRSLVPNEPPAGRFWLDLAQVSDPAASPPLPGQEGPLFLDDFTARALSLSAPKIPRSAGFESFP